MPPATVPIMHWMTGRGATTRLDPAACCRQGLRQGAARSHDIWLTLFCFQDLFAKAMSGKQKGTKDEKVLKLMRSFDSEMRTPKLLDTRLTPTGEAQAAALAASMRTSDARWLLDSLQMVVSSPLSRTLATASIAFTDWLGSNRGRAVVRDEFREFVFKVPMEHRRPRSVLRSEFGHFDFAAVPEEACSWGNSAAAARSHHQRARPFRARRVCATAVRS